MHYLPQLQGQVFPINSTITSIDGGGHLAVKAHCGLLLEIALLGFTSGHLSG